jgi:hypothetical protein
MEFLRKEDLHGEAQVAARAIVEKTEARAGQA